MTKKQKEKCAKLLRSVEDIQNAIFVLNKRIDSAKKAYTKAKLKKEIMVATSALNGVAKIVWQKSEDMFYDMLNDFNSKEAWDEYQKTKTNH